MPDLENLIDMIAEKLDKNEGEAWYSSVNLTYAYGQIPLQELTKIKLLGEVNSDISLYNRILRPSGNTH